MEKANLSVFDRLFLPLKCHLYQNIQPTNDGRKDTSLHGSTLKGEMIKPICSLIFHDAEYTTFYSIDNSRKKKYENKRIKVMWIFAFGCEAVFYFLTLSSSGYALRMCLFMHAHAHGLFVHDPDELFILRGLLSFADFIGDRSSRRSGFRWLVMT